MPSYVFRDVNTGEIVEHTMKMSEYDTFKENNPNLERYITKDTCNVGFKMKGKWGTSLNGGVTQCNPEFEHEVIDRIKRNVPGNKLVKYHATSQNKL